MGSLLVTLLRLASFLFIARALSSWFQVGPDSPVRPLIDTIYRLTEPILAPIRRFLPPMGGLDLSTIVVILGINIVLIPIVAQL